MLEATSQCAVDLSVSAADVVYSMWRMVAHFIISTQLVEFMCSVALAFTFHTYGQVDDGVVTLVNGWVVASANIPFIDLRTVQPSPSSIAPPSLPMAAPLDIFRSGVYVVVVIVVVCF